MTEQRREVVLLAVLIVVAAAFGLGIIPTGIDEGYGASGPGLSTRAMPQLAVMGIVLALAWGLLLTVVAAKRAQEEPGLDETGGAHPLRASGAVLICLFFALLGFQLLGFYIGGVAMAVVLTLLLGERQIFKVLVIPMLVLSLIYALFELGFQIRLPKADFIPGLPL